jgi:hypothetical protein
LSEEGETYLLVRVHAGEAARVGGLAALGRNLLDFLLWAVGEVAWVVVAVVRHLGRFVGFGKF